VLFQPSNRGHDPFSSNVITQRDQNSEEPSILGTADARTSTHLNNALRRSLVFVQDNTKPENERNRVTLDSSQPSNSEIEPNTADIQMYNETKDTL
jgi:hypothetical protein